MDPALIDTIKGFLGTGLTGGSILGFYLMYRKFEAERAAALRQDNQDLREENRKTREENQKLREEIEKLRAEKKARGEDDEEHK